MITENIERKLFSLQDEKYRLFQAKLMPGIEIERIIGVRTPELRKYAKELFKAPEIDEFLNELPHKYYDENNLHGFIISEIKDYETAVCRVDELLPFVDNWATCDQIKPKAFKKNLDKLKTDIDRWISSDHVYTKRFGIEMVMNFFLDEDFDIAFSDKISSIRSDEYYINMMTAWYFATALAKQWDATEPYIKNKRLDVWTHNKAIQKAIESYRITDDRKDYLRTLKIK